MSATSPSYVVRELVRRYACEDYERVAALFDVDAAFDVSRGRARPRSPVDALKAARRRVQDGYADDIVALDDRTVLVVGRPSLRATGRTAGRSTRQVWLHTVQDGKIVHTRLFESRRAAESAYASPAS